MEPSVWLLLLSLAMLVGSYVSGSLPLTTKLSDKKIRILNALGAGLLIGTSLMVVIPEGVETIYKSKSTAAVVNSNNISTKTNTATIPELPSMDLKNNWSSLDTNEIQIMKKRAPLEENEEEEEEEEGYHIAVGLPLVVGFALMLIIDQTSSLHMPALSSGNPIPEYSELGALGDSSIAHDENDLSTRTSSNASEHASITPTVGLVVHAAADGIALGASASHPELSLVVFIAIMLHKAPASFALTSVLLASGLTHNTIRKHLLMFALAAPLGALLTYFALYFFSSSTSTNLEYWTGILLVFSGGTFLYVAMHALQDASHDNHSKDRTQIFIILTGMIIPILLSMTLSH